MVMVILSLILIRSFLIWEPRLGAKIHLEHLGTDMTLIPDSTEIIPIYVASGEQILEATTGTEQDGVPGILTFDDLEVVFNTSTGRVEEGKEGYITTNLTYTHPESDL